VQTSELHAHDKLLIQTGTFFRLFPLTEIGSQGCLKRRVSEMLEAGVPSRVVPYGADQTLFVVIDRRDKATEIRIERNDLEATIGELVAGCFNDPIKVISFNTLEHWMKDISVEIAREIRSRCDIDGVTLPDYLSDFVESHS
jgi:hypothetical protein